MQWQNKNNTTKRLVVYLSLLSVTVLLTTLSCYLCSTYNRISKYGEYNGKTASTLQMLSDAENPFIRIINKNYYRSVRVSVILSFEKKGDIPRFHHYLNRYLPSLNTSDVLYILAQHTQSNKPLPDINYITPLYRRLLKKQTNPETKFLCYTQFYRFSQKYFADSESLKEEILSFMKREMSFERGLEEEWLEWYLNPSAKSIPGKSPYN